MLFKEKFYLNKLKLFICETVMKGKLTLIHVITAWVREWSLETLGVVVVVKKIEFKAKSRKIIIIASNRTSFLLMVTIRIVNRKKSGEGRSRP